jgi:hypothetical protein
MADEINESEHAGPSKAPTFEDAKRCPECSEPGFDKKQEPAFDGKGSMLHHIYCMNNRCSWYDTPWLVQVNADGSIPPPRDHSGSTPEYRGFEGHDEAAVRLLAELNRLNELSTQKDQHGEIRNPFS